MTGQEYADRRAYYENLIREYEKTHGELPADPSFENSMKLARSVAGSIRNLLDRMFIDIVRHQETK